MSICRSCGDVAEWVKIKNTSFSWSHDRQVQECVSDDGHERCANPDCPTRKVSGQSLDEALREINRREEDSAKKRERK